MCDRDRNGEGRAAEVRRATDDGRIPIGIIREPGIAPATPRKREVCKQFGIPVREPPFHIAEDCGISIEPGGILLLVGPSGSGKSSILSVLDGRLERPIRVGRSRFPADRPIVDAVAPGRPLSTALESLTACGLGEPRLWIRRFHDLSDGERLRAELARAVGQAIRSRRPRVILCDEFTAGLHRRLAKAVAYNLRKLITRHRLSLVVATSHDDIAADLQPDQSVRLGGSEPVITHHVVHDRDMSLRRRVSIVPGSLRDYARFSSMHYRQRDRAGFVDQVFLLRETATGEALGILVFTYASPELALRNRSTGGRFIRDIRRLNRELRILRRLIIHPDIRGCGLGHYFVRQALPRVGVRFVECLAAMGAINPVFERAGMRRVGRCALPKGRRRLLMRMLELDVDPLSPYFSSKIVRCPRVRRLVEETIRGWVETTQGGSQYRVAGRSAVELSRVFRQLHGSPPVYYLWDREGEFPGP
ncbi:MAG: hypothetical protein ACE5EQ_06665 [Phycisphaerae bacterium]